MNTLVQMNKYPDEGWINQLYEETEQLLEKHKDPSGYAIFYSPAFINPGLPINMSEIEKFVILIKAEA